MHCSRYAIFTLTALLASNAATAQVGRDGSPLIDYRGFAELTAKLEPFRKNRLLSMPEFQERAVSNDALVLDARSEQAFKEGHIRGAINLPLPDFTAESLAQVIGANPDREILIYCNNNFINNRRPVMTKALPLALNIQTFINLYGYGYKNVWELGEAVDLDDPMVGWVSAAT